jgi:TRAP-type C4-dicarboxylate transport system permease small subunit
MDQLRHAITMNINQHHTKLSLIDHLKHFFQGIFGVLPAAARGHVVAVIGELIGTIFFIFFAFASASSNNAQGSDVSTATSLKSPQQLLYISLSFGFSLVVCA